MDENQGADIWSMSDDEFSKASFGSDVETSEEVSITSEEPEDVEETVTESADESTSEVVEEVEETSDDDDDEVEPVDESPTVDIEAEYRKLIGSPIKANGTELVIDSVDDAIKLIQMGANYYKKVEQLKPAQKVITMLEKAGMLDEQKLSFAIDLLNKDKGAIAKLVEGMDTYELQDEQHKDYVPTNRSVSDEQLTLDNVIQEVSSTPTGHRTLEVLGTKWDMASRETVVSNPEVIRVLNQHMADGTFDTVSNEVEKQRMLGNIPAGLNNIQAYKFVGDQLYAGKGKVAPQGQQPNQQPANAGKPIHKPSKETVVQQRRAASNSARTPSQSLSNNMENVFALSDEEFRAKYGKF